MIVLLLAATLSLGATALAAPSPSALNAEAYAAELQRLQGEIESLSTRPQTAEALRKSLPDHWTVSTAEAEVAVDTAFLREALKDFQVSPPDRKRALLDQLQRRLAAMRAGSQGFLQPDRADAAMRKRLDNILAAREFSSVHPPSLLEIWRDKIVAALERWFRRASARMPDVPGLGRFFVWFAIAIATSLLAIWLYRYARQRAPEQRREVMQFAPSAKSWRRWLAEADAAAAEGNWRDAVHLAYWAAVSYLESSGMWRPDRARTPREYVKALAPSHPSRTVFSALTRRFEAIWYGDKPAGAPDFQQARAELESLGCR